MSAETEPAARRSHRDAVYDKAADAGRPEPVPLTEELCVEVAGEHPSSARVIELLFTSLEPLPALLCCEQLQELTLMHARMRRMPPELQHLRPTLRRLSLGGNEIEVIEHLDGMVRLHSLFLHENRIRSPAGLRGCTALERLWLNGNRIESLGNELGQLTALRELWLQANPLESPSGLEGLASLQVLSRAGSRAAPTLFLALALALPLPLALVSPRKGSPPNRRTPGRSFASCRRGRRGQGQAQSQGEGQDQGERGAQGSVWVGARVKERVRFGFGARAKGVISADLSSREGSTPSVASRSRTKLAGTLGAPASQLVRISRFGTSALSDTRYRTTRLCEDASTREPSFAGSISTSVGSITRVGAGR